MGNVFDVLIKDIVDRIATITATKVEAVSKGSQRFVPTKFPLALISIGRIVSAPAEMGNDHYLEIPIEIVVIIMDTAPTDWLTDVIAELGPIIDALMDDPTLTAKCNDSYLTYCEPARLTLSGEGIAGKIYYGGLIGYLVKAFYQA